MNEDTPLAVAESHPTEAVVEAPSASAKHVSHEHPGEEPTPVESASPVHAEAEHHEEHAETEHHDKHAEPVHDEESAHEPPHEVSEPMVAEEPASVEHLAGDSVTAPTVEAESPAAEAPAPKKKRGSGLAAAKAKPAEETPPADEPAPAAEAAAAPAEGVAPPAEPVVESKKKWYVIKVTSNREESIKAAIERRVKIEGLEEFFGQILIPVERITQVKKVVEKKKDTGEKVTKEKRVIKENKKFPGYLFAEVEYNDRILYLFRETSGVGDFVGASLHRAPTPMTDREVQAMLHGVVDPKDKKGGGKTVVKLDFEKGDKVRIREGAFANSEGEVKQITEPKDPGDTPKVTVVVMIWGRGVDVELDYWQVDKI